MAPSDYWQIVRNSLFIPVLAIPVAALLFFVLPRTSYPLFNLLSQKEKAHTGFSDHVQLGAVSSIQEDSAVAFRVTMRPVGQHNLYWRGIVFDQFDGRGWSSSGRPVPLPSGAPEGESVIQTIYLEPRETRYLIALDKPDFVAMKNASQVDDGSFVSPAILSGRTRYMARSTLSEWFPERGTDMSRYLQVPDNMPGPLLRLAKRLGDGKTDMERIRSVYRYLNDGTFRYSLENLPVTAEPVSTFLFQTKYGNCEYFASSYAIILRLLDIPSRIVGGYKGGQYNSMGGYYLVPEKNAHVWVEAHLKGKGWLRIDPTPAGIGQFPSSEKEHLFMRAGLFFDTLNYYWYAFVINYNLEKQLSLARAMRGAFRISRTTGAPVIEWKKWAEYTGFILFGCTACVFLRNVRLRRRSREEKLLIAFVRKMERSGYHKKESQGLEEFISTIGDRRIGQLASEFVKEFQAFYFRDLPVSPKEAKHLKRRIKSI
ncbi:MAG TPA: transglutaminaseTgpA domain-containing protein [Syntrophorhabdaceae bacterium]